MPIGAGLIIPGAVAPVGAPTIDVDAVDKAAALLPGLLSFQRAKRVVDPNVAYKDRMGLTFTPQGAGAVKSAADANFNGKPVIDYAATNGQFTGKIGANMPASFTFLAAMRVPAWKAANCFLADDAGFTVYFTATGQMVIDTNWFSGATGESGNINQFFNLNETCLVWVSYDSGTKIARWGKNSAAQTGQVQLAKARAVAAGQQPRPFSFSANNQPGNFNAKCPMWTLANVAYGSGVGTSDAPLTNLINAAKTYWAIP